MIKRTLPFVRLGIVLAALLVSMNIRADYTTCNDMCSGKFVGCKSMCDWWNVGCYWMCQQQYTDCANCCLGSCGDDNTDVLNRGF
jgi:hypothetical protein